METAALVRTKNAIGDWVLLANDAGQLASEMMLDDGDRGDCLVVALRICDRLRVELRCAILLCERGYPVQAASNAATMAELAFTIGYIANDTEMAKKWMAHDDIEGFQGVRKMLTSSLYRAKLSTEPLIEQEFDQYKRLCMAKHGNPIVFLSFGLLVEHAHERTVRGAYGALAERYLSRWVLACAVEYMLLGSALLNRYNMRDKRARIAQLTELHRIWKAMRSDDDDKRLADFPPAQNAPPPIVPNA